jgi:hypothetical protein
VRGLLTGLLGQRAPVAVAEALDVVDQDLVLLGRPWPLLEPHLLAARSPPHYLVLLDLLLRRVLSASAVRFARLACLCRGEVWGNAARQGEEGEACACCLPCLFVFGDGSTVLVAVKARVESRGCPAIYLGGE